jgi:hypothetical protein
LLTRASLETTDPELAQYRTLCGRTAHAPRGVSPSRSSAAAYTSAISPRGTPPLGPFYVILFFFLCSLFFFSFLAFFFFCFFFFFFLLFGPFIFIF